jgi:iron(III) transport system permease protein
MGRKEQVLISPMVLEQKSGWRIIGMSLILLLALLPSLALVVSVSGSSSQAILLDTFWQALSRSLLLALIVTLVSLLLGLPTGVLIGLYEFPGRRIFLALLALPLLIPSFLWAIGLLMFRLYFELGSDGLFAGLSGASMGFISLSLPLVIYTSFLSVRTLSQGQVDSALLCGSQYFLFKQTLKLSLPYASLIAVFGGVLTLSDPGPGQILGYAGIATELLVSFSALYDFSLAARQSLILIGVILFLLIPVVMKVSQSPILGLLGRDFKPAQAIINPTASWSLPLIVSLILLFTVLIPLTGLTQPLLREFPFKRAVQEVLRTINDTLLYSFFAGVIATVIGLFLSMLAGRDNAARRLLLAASLFLLSIPPAVSALGMILLGSYAPVWMEHLLRGRFAVALLLGLRFLPIATILSLRKIGTSSPTWAQAASLHGLSLWKYLKIILLPWFFPSGVLIGFAVALLATADITTIVLLRPPDADSFPLAIFTIMANAPEALVAALCLFYIGGAALAIAAITWIGSNYGKFSA